MLKKMESLYLSNLDPTHFVGECSGPCSCLKSVNRICFINESPCAQHEPICSKKYKEIGKWSIF